MVKICISRKFIFVYVSESKTSKKIYKEIVPKAVDEYLDCIEKSKNQK